MKLISVTIDRMAAGGAGFGQVEGKACFVPFTLPGDTVLAQVRQEKKSFITAVPVELVVPSPDRIHPRCPVFGQCGGCALQQMPYEQQLTVKRELFADQMYRFGRVERSRIEPVRPAENPWHYRSRVQIKLYRSTDRVLMGFYRSGSHYVVPFPGCCAIASPLVNRIIAELENCLPLLPFPERIPQIDVATGDNGEAIVIVHHIGDDGEAVSSCLRELHPRLLPSVNGLWLQTGRKSSLHLIRGIEKLSYSAAAGSASSRLIFSRGGFSQVNFWQNQTLVDLVYEMAALTGTERVLDLYCGNGNFSVPLSAFAAEVTGIEAYEPSIDDARQNAFVNNRRNATFICDDAAQATAGLARRGQRFDLVLLDPPRTGAADVMANLPALRPSRIIYVSCDPATLARDVAILAKLNYSVRRSVPVDMFPQTGHLESVTLIERN